jgi:hypothetical protein
VELEIIYKDPQNPQNPQNLEDVWSQLDKIMDQFCEEQKELLILDVQQALDEMISTYLEEQKFLNSLPTPDEYKFNFVLLCMQLNEKLEEATKARTDRVRLRDELER